MRADTEKDPGKILGGSAPVHSTAVGYNAVANFDGAVSIMGRYTGQFAVAIGNSSSGGHQFGVAIGYAAESQGDAFACGYRAKAGAKGVAIGRDSNAGHYGVVIGEGVVSAQNEGVLGTTSAVTTGTYMWRIPGRLEVGQELVRTSPNGTRWNITVDDAGVISAVAATI